MAFIDRIIQYSEENNLNYNDLTIVLPSQRAKKFLETSFFEHSQQVMLSPLITTMDAWIKSLVPTIIIDKTRLLILLYDVHRQVTNNKDTSSFDEFMEWGNILLSDFDEIDRYLVDPPTLFKSLYTIKELDYWQIDDLNPTLISDARRKFMEFWQRLPMYYQKLHEELQKKNSTYMGAAYQYVANNIDSVLANNLKNNFLFAGFNALSTAEEQIIHQLYTLGCGHVLIDADSFYLNNRQHEAGSFIRTLYKKLDVQSLSYVENRLTNQPMNVQVIECAQLTGQVKVAASYLLQLDKDELSQTAIVLADEELIAPLLKNIPKQVQTANITLGMPLKSTSVRNWVDIILSIQEIKQRFGNSKTYYHTNLKQLLNHPFFTTILTNEEKNKAHILEQTILQRNWIFIPTETIKISNKIDKILQLIGTYWNNNWQHAMETIRKLNRLLFNELSEQNSYEKALIHSFDTALIDLHNITKEPMPQLNLRTFKHLFNQHYSSARIAYFGSPIDGLQIMGLLETRSLNFKNILFLGLNEGTLPPTNPIQSLIPMDLRRFVSLPTPRDKQGLFAHHFYRLLHHCENLTITYSGTKEAVGSNEKSRYLLQIEKELVRQNPNISYHFQFYNVPMKTNKYVKWKSVQKTEDIVAKMDKLFAQSTSISALNNYHQCPLDFYFKYILEFGEDDAVEEELEASSFGTIVHKTLEQLYTPHAKFDKNDQINPSGGKPLKVEHIDNMLAVANTIIENAFIKQFNGDKQAFAYGKNNLSFTMAKKMVNDYLQEEKKRLQNPTTTIIIHSLEKKIKTPIELTIHDQKKTMLLVGTIDRIDELNGKIRLIDYKTGNCKDDDVKLKTSTRSEKTQMQQNMEVKHIMQLLMYCFLYWQSTNQFPDTAGIYSMLRLNKGLCEMNLNGKTIPEMNQLFPSWLHELMNEIYNPEIPFEHKNGYEKTNYCTYCN